MRPSEMKSTMGASLDGNDFDDLFKKNRSLIGCKNCGASPGEKAVWNKDGNVSKNGRQYPRFKCSQCNKSIGKTELTTLLKEV